MTRANPTRRQLVFRAGDLYGLFVLVKVDGRSFERALSFMKGLLSSFSDSPHRQYRCSFVLQILGKYDLLLILEGRNLGEISRFSYQILERLEACCGPKGLKDFTRIPTFQWASTSKCLESAHAVGLVQVKLANPLMSFADKRKTVLGALLSLHTYNFQLYGGLAWHEIIIILKGVNFSTIPEFLLDLTTRLENPALISECSSIPAWEPGVKYPKFDMTLSVLLKLRSLKELPHVTTHLPGSQPRLGYVDLEVNQRVVSISNLETLLASYDRKLDALGITKLSSVLSFSRDLLPERLNSPPITARAVEQPVFSAPLSLNRRDIVLQEKIDAVRIQLRVLQNDARFSYLVPTTLINTLESLDFDAPFLSQSDIAGYLSTLRHAIQQRLAGSYPAAATGFVTGYVDGYGGYQRIILAAESLLARSLRIMLGSGIRLPHVLVLFDQRGLHQSDFTVYQSVRRLDRGAPLVVRLRALKYEPWYWHQGIRDIGYWCVELDRFFRREVSGEDFFGMPLKRVGDHVCSVLKRRLYIELCATEGDTPFAVKCGDNAYKFDPTAYRDLADEVADCADISVDPTYDHQLEARFARCLSEGEVLSEELENDNNFRVFLNSFYSLGLEERREPHTAIAFLLSLYATYRFSQPSNRGDEHA